MARLSAVNARAPRALILSLATAAALSACSGESKKAPESDLARDLALAAAQPTQLPTNFTDTALATAPERARSNPAFEPAPVRTPQRSRPTPQPKVESPRRVAQQPAPEPQTPVARPLPAPAPSPAPALEPAARKIGAGTSVALSSASRVCTNNLPGDKIVATVSTAVIGSNGAAIPVGSTVVLEVASVTAGSSADNARIAFRVRAIVINDQSYPVTAEVAALASLEKERVANADPNADRKKVIGGAIAGAILGHMIGKNARSTIVGAAAGAATGAAVAKNGERWEGCLPQGSPMRLTLNVPLIIS
jgi:Glycine zipper 2TM domain